MILSALLIVMAASSTADDYTTINNLLQDRVFSIPDMNVTNNIKIGPGTVSDVTISNLVISNGDSDEVNVQLECDLTTELSVTVGKGDAGNISIQIKDLQYNSSVSSVHNNSDWAYGYCHSEIKKTKTTITGFSYLTRTVVKEWINHNLASVFCWKSIPGSLFNEVLKLKKQMRSHVYDPNPNDVAAIQEQKYSNIGHSLFNTNKSKTLNIISNIATNVLSAPQPSGKTAFGMSVDDSSLWGDHPHQPVDYPNSMILYRSKQLPMSHHFSDSVRSPVRDEKQNTAVIDQTTEDQHGNEEWNILNEIGMDDITVIDDSDIGVKVSVTEVMLHGLDSVADIDLKSVGNYSIFTTATLTDISADVKLLVTLTNPVTGFNVSSNAVITLSGLKELSISLSMLMAADPSRLSEIFIADLNFPKSKGILPLIKYVECLTFPLIGFNISTVTVKASSLSSLSQSGIIPGLDKPINGMLTIMNSIFSLDVLRYKVPYVIGSEVTSVDKIVSDVLNPFMNQSKCNCTPPSKIPDNNNNKYIQLNESIVIDAADWIVNGLFSSGHGMSLSALLNTLGISEYNILNHVVGGSLPIGGGVLSIHIKQLSVSNLNQQQDSVKILVPDFVATNLNSSASLFDLNFIISMLNISFTGGNDQPPFEGKLSLNITFSDLNAGLTTVTKLLRKQYRSLPISKLFSPSCLISLLDVNNGFQIQDFLFHMSEIISTKVSVHSQLGLPGLEDFINAFQSHGGRLQLTNGLNNMSKIINTIMGRNATQHILNNVIQRAGRSCDVDMTELTSSPPTPTPTHEHTEVSDAMQNWEVFVGVYGTALFIGLIFLTIGCCKSKNSVDSRSNSDVNEIQKGCDTDADSETPSETEDLLAPEIYESKYKALYCHPAIPLKVRVGMPIGILMTTAVFLTANILLGARVHAVVLLFGSEVRLNNVFQYTLASTISNMYNGKAYALGVIVAVFSGVWPYVKLLILLFCWFVSPERISRGTRGYVLRVIDILGKWSLVDDFMMVMMMVAFRMSFLPSPEWEFTTPSTFDVELVIDPCYGMYGFLTAAIATLILNHIQIICHRNCLEYDEGYKQSWLQVGKSDPTRRVLSSFQNPVVSFFVVFLLFVALTLVLLGCSVHSFSFQFEGLAGGFLLATDPNSQHKPYSVFSVAVAMWNQAGPSMAGYMGYFYLMFAFVLFAFCMPVLQLFLLGVLWLAPLRIREQKLLFFSNEIIAAWSSLEVFVVALIAALMEIPEFSQFMIGSACDQINTIMSDLQGPLALPSAKCFNVGADLLPGCWILFSAAVMSNVAFQVTWKSADKLIKQMEHSTDAKRLSQSTATLTPREGV